jgi:hypothetical protein
MPRIREQAPARGFDVRLPLRYVVLRKDMPPITGTGESINVSRTGMVFRSDGRLQEGEAIITALDWPAQAPDGEPLFLVLFGSVIRTKRSLIATAMQRHRFLRLHEFDRRFEFWAGSTAMAKAATVAPPEE